MNEIIVKFGFRTYCFYNRKDVSLAREIWIKPCSQDVFERLLGDAGIDFIYELEA